MDRRLKKRAGKAGFDLMRRGIATFLRGAQEVSGARRLAGAGVPALVARAWRDDLLAGYRLDPAEILRPLSARSTEDLVAARDIEFTSICMHHLMPFVGRVHIAYAPDGRITGLSRLASLVDCLSRRLQLQETLTRQIADAIQRHLAPAGAACLIEASHTCMTMRGSRKSRSRIVTVAFTGSFRRDVAARREVLSLLTRLPRRAPTRTRERFREEDL